MNDKKRNKWAKLKAKIARLEQELAQRNGLIADTYLLECRAKHKAVLKVVDATVKYFESDCEDAEFDARAFRELDEAVREYRKLKEGEA